MNERERERGLKRTTGRGGEGRQFLKESQACHTRHGPEAEPRHDTEFPVPVHGAQRRVFTAALLRCACKPDASPISAFSQYDLHTTLYTHVYRLHGLGPREPQHHDLVSTEAREVDLVAVHKDCGNLTFRLEAYTLQDVA